MMRKLHLATKVSLLVTLVLLIGFVGLWGAVDNKSSNLVGNMISEQMKDSVQSRSYIINNYVNTAESYMIAFAQADEVKALLADPKNEKKVEKAQTFTSAYGEVAGMFEGLYIATYETETLTHTNDKAIGMILRTGDSYENFKENVLSKHELTNLGIIISPSSGNMVISMYYPVFDEQDKCLGFVGGAVFANKLMDSLLSLEVKGLPNSEYVFINAATGEYLYNENEELLCQVTEDKGYLDLIEKLNSGSAEETGLYEYTDETGIEQVVVYQYITERGWMFAIKDTNANVYQSLTTIKKVTGISCAVVGIITIILLVLILLKISHEIKLVSVAISTLGEMDLSADHIVSKYSKRGDEIGIVCNALNTTCSNLREYINEMELQLSYMANGEFIHEPNMVFEGDFTALQESLKMIQVALRNSFSEISVVTKELNIGSQSVADTSSSLANAAAYSNSLIMEIDDRIEDISNQLAESEALTSQAKDESTKAAEVVENSKVKMEELNASLEKISEASSAIEGISAQIENIAKQTNILALNALVEATRAGDAGSGFGVVADEIRNLAEKSDNASKNAAALIQETQLCVKQGIDIGNETIEYLNSMVEQTEIIDKNVTKVADYTKQQNEKLSDISSRVRDISKTVDNTAAMAQESAAASEELDGQANVLRSNISKYRIE